VDPGDPTPSGAPVGRRVVLGMVGLGALGVAFGAQIEGGIQSVLAPIRNNDPTGLTGLIPGEGGFRYYSVTASKPDISVDDFQLRIGGLVRREQTLTYDDLAQLPQTQLTRDFQCVTGWRVQDVAWQGVQLRDLLTHVGVTPTAKALAFKSADGAYTESLTLDQVNSIDCLVATHMEGGVVSREHGGPVRLYVAPMYGYKSLKWLNEIDLVDQVQPGYWEQRGYDVDAYVGASNGRHDPST
jgi:DMSO/TMAO reductase YedYZ molybdopterin-dependent catalytic subunit